MALPPWTIELLRRGVSDMARRAGERETLNRLRDQATELFQELPETAARGIDRVMRTAEVGRATVQKWSRKHTALAVPMLNASGVLFHELGTGVRLAAQVVEVGQEFLAGDVCFGSEADRRVRRRLQRALPDAGDLAVAVASSFPAALSALTLVGSQRELTVHRRHAVRILDGVPLPEAFGAELPMVQEVGGCDRVMPGDFDGLERPCVILADDGQSEPSLVEFGDSGALQALILPVATVAGDESLGVPSAESRLRRGAGIVVMPGDGLAGGPACGLLIGRREEIEAIESSASWASLEAPVGVRAMMCAALESAASETETVPIQELVATGEPNLKDRAERLATRLSGCESIAATRVTAGEARLTASGRWRLPSRQVTIAHRTLTASDWAARLGDDLPIVATDVEGELLRVDLRWLHPADDSRLADALSG